MSNFTDFFPAASGGGGGGIPKYQDFTSSGTFTPTQALIDAGGRVAYLAVGGGQRGFWQYNSNDYPEGGTGGQVKFGYATLTSTTGCAVTIGAGGTGDGSGGGDTTIAFNSAGGTAVTSKGGSGGALSYVGPGAGAKMSISSSTLNKSGAQSGALGFGGGGSAQKGAAEQTTGIISPLANTGGGSAKGTNAADGFVRITWFE